MAKSKFPYLDRAQVLTVAGTSLLVLGVALPAWTFPIFGDISYMQRAEVEGWIILALALASAVAACARAYRYLWFTGLVSLAAVTYSVVAFLLDVRELRTKVDTEFAGHAFHQLAVWGVDSMQLQWSLLVLLVGIAFLLATAAMYGRRGRPTQ